MEKGEIPFTIDEIDEMRGKNKTKGWDLYVAIYSL